MVSNPYVDVVDEMDQMRLENAAGQDTKLGAASD
jgi:hypothetical protein